MNILFVNRICGYFGGVEQNVRDVAAGLRSRGHRCWLAFGVTSSQSVDEYRAGFDGAHQVAELSDRDHPSDLTLDALVRDLDPGVIYLHKVPSLAALNLLPSKTRCVAMVHDHDVTCPRGTKYYCWNGRICRHPAGWRCFADAAFLKRDPRSPLGVGFVDLGTRFRDLKAYRKLDRVLVASRAMREELIVNGFDPGRVFSVSCSVRSSQAPRRTPVSEKPSILYVGQLIRGKGVDRMLEALSRVRVDYEAVLVGRGNAEPSLRALTRRLGLEDRVRFEGWVHNRDIGRYYERSRLSVVPSRWPEPFGMVGLEAMSHGRPVVAFNVGGIPDWLEDGRTGLLVREGDVSAMAAAIEELLKDRAKAESMGVAAFERVQQKFDFERYLSAVEEHLA